MAAEVQSQTPRPRNRPRSVTILAWLQFLQNLAVFGFGLYWIILSGWQPVGAGQGSQYLPLAIFDWMRSGPVMVILATLGFLTFFALLRLKPWAWTVAMSFQGLGLLAALTNYIRHQPNYLGMLVSTMLVLYLNMQEIQVAFREKRADPGQRLV